jgi:hypothetical protein
MERLERGAARIGSGPLRLDLTEIVQQRRREPVDLGLDPLQMEFP